MIGLFGMSARRRFGFVVCSCAVPPFLAALSKVVVDDGSG
ncbi:hypothetical protein SynBIOSU31_02809 [Synechococcus sp. BIOS-U3-1]|nr:hypothetical protein SynBIOSU31_02809 [Synechococcus sp. BIOS-U3-1]